ncbi:MAG: hypothetical protein DMG58_03270 [Acidobacteria bacterium]|nr:MAG: hypothetical protein DMG58_03270 [Acidobacteriota bacterium]
MDAGIDKARDFVKQCVVGDPSVDSVLSTDEPPGPLTDFKSALQELARARNLALPRYVIIKEHGPEHAKTFTIEVRLGKDWVAQAEGYSKKNAAQNAARVIFEQLSGAKPGASL